MHNMKKVFTFLFISLMLLTLLGCTKTTPITAPSTSTIITPLEPRSLTDVTWILKSYGDVTNMTQVLPNWKDITLTFNGTLDGYTGYDGANYYNGACLIQNDYSITMSVITSTKIGYSDNPLGIIKQIQTYYDLLLEAKSFSINGYELAIYCGSGKALRFSRLAN